MKKSLLLMSDMHTGHTLGLNPPSLFVNATSYPAIYKVQKALYEWYVKSVSELKIDGVINAGDFIDGAGKKNGGKELREQSMIEQAYAAAELINLIPTKTKILVVGTPYHSTEGANLFDSIVAKEVDSYPLKDKQFVNIQGTDINIKVRHKIGSSAIFNGRHTAAARAKMDNIFSALKNDEPSCRILLFGHVHYQRITGQLSGSNWWQALTLPCLQLGSDYGDRECNGSGVDVGMMLMHIDTQKTGSAQVTFEPIDCPVKQTQNKEIVAI
jgi:hypothetical protein